MKSILTMMMCFLPFAASCLDFEVKFDDQELRISRWRLEEHEEVGFHSDDFPAIVYALQGGIITRVAKDGSTKNVSFPTKQIVWRPADPSEHRSINPLDTPLEAMMIEFKDAAKNELIQE